MADERNPKIVSAEDYAVSLDSGDAIGSSGIVEALKEINRQSESAPVQDSAVGVLDTLQSIASVPLALAPGHKLAHAAERSQWLDQWRSPAYLAERQRDAERVAETTARDGEWAGLVEAFKRSATGVTAVPDVVSQAPYLAAIGPLARAMGFAAKAEATGIVSKIVQGTAGTGEGAVANRVAMLSGILEGAGSYGQTEERVLRETGNADEATRQARIAGASALIAGVVLGRATPELEMNPTGLRGLSTVNRQFLSDAIAPTALAVGGEVIEESGMAITNTVTDNVMNGRDPMEGVGGAVGQAAAISSLFAGGMRAPGLVRDTSVAIGLGVVKGLRGLSQNLQDKATTPEQAGTDAATDVLQETLSSAENAAAVPSETSSAGEVIQSTEAVASEVPEFVLDGNAPQTLRRDRRKSNSQAVESVLLNAQYELAIDQTSDEEAKNQLIATQTELAEDVEKATQAIEKLSPEAVAARVEQNDEQSQMLVEAVRLTDVTKLPESALSEDEKVIVESIRDFKESGVDRTAEQIFESGFAGIRGSRGIRGFLQSILNYGRLIGDKPNDGSNNLTRFVSVLEDRAKLFKVALDQVETARANGVKVIDVVGTKTLDKNGNLIDRPFKLHVNNPNSIAVAERVLADAARARGALENARSRFPGMFKGVASAEVVGALTASPKLTKAIEEQVTPPAATAPAAPTPSPAAAKVETPAAEEGGLSLEAEEAPVDRTVPDLEANAKKEEGRYPDQPKRPESTRIEDEKGLIDVDMRGNTWIGTNNYSNPKEAEKGDGLQRLLTVLRMAKAAGKKYNSDQSLSGSALGMYMKAIKDGVITATSRVSQKDLEDALAGRDGIRTTDSTTIDPEMSVFQDVQIVEETTSAAPVEVKPTAEEKAAARRERKNRKAREKRAAAKAAKEAAAQQEATQEETVDEAAQPPVVEAPVPTIVEEVEAREDAPPSLSDEEMDSLMVSAEEDQESWFEAGEETATTEETEIEQASNPLTVEPLAEGQSWLNPTFLDAFKLDPVKSVKAMMAKLLQAARNDGAYLTRYAANVRPALDKVFAAGIAKKFADASKLETYLKRPFGVFAQAIVRNADGSLEVHPAIRDALAHAAVLQLHRAPDQYDKDSLVDPKTGLPIRSAQVHAWARAIARDTALLLGMKPNKKESEALTQGVLLSLALSTVQALVDNTDVVLIQVEGINVVYPSDAALATWKNHPKLVDNVANIIGAPRVYTASTTPSTNIPERVNHSSTQTSESQKTSIQNLNSVPHYMNPIMMRMLEIVGQAGFNRLATGITWRDKLPEPIQKWLKAKITGITSEIRAANHYQQMLGKAVNDPLFWEYGIDSNGRMNSFMGPQGYTLLRDLFSSARATINLTNAIHVAKTELAIAQALGIKLDQTTLEVEKAYRKKVVEVGDAAKKLVTAIKKANDLDPEAPDYASEADALGREVMATLERGTPLKPRELAGMITLGELLLAQEAGQTELVTFLPIEVDGKTNGAVNAELLYGLGGTISEVNLEQGGVFLTDGTPNWGERITYIIDKWKDKDLYLRVARTAVPLFQSGMGERLEDAGLSYWDELMDGPPANDFGNSEIDNETLTELLIATDMLTADGTAFQREAAKRASNPTVYGAGKLGVASQLIADMRNNLISKWVALDFELQKSPKNVAEIKAQMDRLEALLNMDKSIWEEAALTAGSALLEAYKIQKPNVTRVTALMVKLTSFAFALKLAQWSGMHEELLMSDPRNVAIMEEFKKTPAYQTYLKTGRGRPNLWPASREQYQDILNNTFRLRFATSANPEMVNLDDAENNPSAFRVEGLGTSFSASLDLPQPANPRVSALALTTIGAGDASMVTLFLQQFRQITNVWDGIEMIPTEVDSLSVELNKAAWDAVQFDVLEAYEQTATLLRQRLETLTPEMQQAVLATYNNLVPKFYRYNTFFTDPNVQRAGKPVPGLHEAVRELEQELIRERAAQLKGQAELRAKPIHFVQMANGNGYSPGQQTRDATASPERQAGWSDAIDGAFQALGDKAGRQSVINMLDNVKWNRIQAFVWKRLKPLLPAGLTVSFARNAQQWTELTGKNDYGLVNGRTFIDGDRVVLATAAPHIMLHEVMHATLTKLIANYAINPASVPAHVRTAVNNLMQLLPAFRALKDPRLKTVQNQIWKLQDVWQDTAAAVDEMMAYVLTEPDVMNAVSPKFFQRLVMRVKEVFWSFLGKEVPNSFLDEVLKSFTALTNDIISEDMGSPIAGTYRDSLNTLDALAQRALDGLAQVAAKRPGMKVGNIVDDSMIKAVMKAYTLTPEQHGLHRRIYTLLKLNARKGDLEQFVSTVLPKHPQANLFNGAVDLTASVLALAAVEPTFAAQLEKIYQEERGEVKIVESLIDKVLDANQRPTVEGMVTDALNAIAMDSEYELSLLGTLTHSADRFGQRILEKVGEKAEEWAEDAPRGISDALQGVNALLTEDGAEAFGRGLMDYVNTLTNNQALQSLIGALVGSQNDTNAVYRQVKRFKSMVARTRAEFTTVLPQVLKNLFPETFEGWNDLYEHFARLGVEVLNSDAALMFTDSDARKRMITALESKVPNKWDAQNLAHYMVHGKLPENTPHKLLRNARAIADNLNGTPVTATDDLVADVDQLVTLYAIEALPEKQRAKIAGYFKAHPGQMQNLIGLLQKVREEEDKGLTSANRYIHWKGELPLTTDPRHSIVIAGRVQGAKLEQLGYTRGDKYQQSAEDPQKDLYYYTRPYAPPPVFAQGILATVQQTAKGVNYTTSSTITPEVNTMITERRLVEAINRNPSLASKLIPVHNYQGQVVGYERMLDRQKVRDYTNSNNTLLHISIGQKLGRILEERWAVRFNKEAIQILVNQWEDGKRRGTENQYESVNSTTSKQIARAWEVVPGHIKKQLETAFGGPVMIRRDLIENTLGYYNAGVGDVYTGNASLSEETRKAMIGLTQTLFGGPRAAQILAASEAAIKEGVGTARDWIIVRSISVAYNNFMASLHLVVANGVPIRDVIKYYRQGMADIRVYNRLQVENIELMVKIAAAQGTEKARLQTLQKNKMTTMKRLAIYPLIESGELSDLPEGLIEAPDNTYLGDFTGWLNKKMSHIHPKMPMVVANIAIAKDSQFHDTLSKAIQAGDFLGRYAVYQHMVNTGQGQQNAIDKVRDEFVAYAINPGRMRGYLENMGVVHWTQFTIRAQKVLLNRLRQNPFSFFMSQMASGVTGADGPLEMAVTERGLDNSIGIDNTFGAMNAHIYSKLL